jgi:hypothetical protein
MTTFTRAPLLDRSDELRAVSIELQRTAQELCGDLMSRMAIMQRLVTEADRLRSQRATPTEPMPSAA